MRPRRAGIRFTGASATVTLFSRYDDSGRSFSLLASAVLHALVATVIVLGIIHTPENPRIITGRYAVRQIDLKAPPAASLAAYALQAHNRPAPAALPRAAHAPTGPQTLLQPDLPVQVADIKPIPLPQLMIWTPGRQAAKNVVPPQPAPAASASARPSPDTPNREIELSDMEIASSPLPTAKLALMPSTTTPIAERNPGSAQRPPTATAQQAVQPTPAAILSISDLRLNNGEVHLPPVNEALRSNTAGELLGSPRGAAAGQSPEPDAAGGLGAYASGPTSSNGAGVRPTATRITLPRDGRFGAVVIGESVEDRFPEMQGLWSGRMAYTVYLHVGLAHSWILQYSLPAADDAAANGSISRLEAPWPFSIVRPDLSPADVNADALMVHGFVNRDGRFEDLAMVFPTACPQAAFVLKSLEQWQFRPALRDGQTARVEVLLIIPEEMD